jgi:hypothetical protein
MCPNLFSIFHSSFLFSYWRVLRVLCTFCIKGLNQIYLLHICISQSVACDFILLTVSFPEQNILNCCCFRQLRIWSCLLLQDHSAYSVSNKGQKDRITSKHIECYEMERVILRMLRCPLGWVI